MLPKLIVRRATWRRAALAGRQQAARLRVLRHQRRRSRRTRLARRCAGEQRGRVRAAVLCRGGEHALFTCSVPVLVNSTPVCDR